MFIGSQTQCPVTTQGVAWGGFRKEGTYVCLWLIHIVVWQQPTKYCNAIILQLKICVFFQKGKKKSLRLCGPWLGLQTDCQIIFMRPQIFLAPPCKVKGTVSLLDCNNEGKIGTDLSIIRTQYIVLLFQFKKPKTCFFCFRCRAYGMHLHFYKELDFLLL